MPKRIPAKLLARAALVGAGLSHSFLQAATFTWDAGGGDTNWTTAANWLAAAPNNNTVPPVASDVQFGTGGTTATVNAAQTVGSIQFNRAGGFTVNGASTLTITTGVGVTTAANYLISAPVILGTTGPITTTWDIITGGQLTVTGIIAEPFAGISNSITKTGGGILVLNNAGNNYDGTVTINAGTISVSVINNQGTTGDLGDSGSLLLNGGALRYTGATHSTDRSFALGLAGGTIDASGGGPLTMSGAISFFGNGARTLTFAGTNTGSNTFSNVIANQGAGSITSITKSGTGRWVLTGTNTYTGTTTVSDGILQLGAAGTTGELGTGIVTNNAQIVVNRTNAYTLANDMSGTGSFTQAGSGTTILTGANTYSGTTTVSAGTLQVGAGGTTGALGTGNVTDNSTLAFNRTNTLTVPNVISGTGHLFQVGTGTTILTGANTYSGTTTVSAGTLQVGAGGTAGALGTGNVTDNSTLAFNRTNTFTVPNVISGTGHLFQVGTGTTILTGANTYSGTTMISGGVLQIGAGGTTGQLGTGDVTNNGELVLNRTNAFTVANNISGTGSLAQTGSNTTALTGANTYSGITTISTGTLQIGSGGTSGSLGSGNVTNNSTIAFNRTNTLTVPNVISGSGHLYQTGTGTTVLSGASTYAGNTNITTGTLALSGGADRLPTSTSVIMSGTSRFDLGSNNQTIASITGAALNTVALGSATLTVNGSANTTFQGVISGVGGSIVKAGTGSLALTGANTFTGRTWVSAGTLSINTVGNDGVASSIGAATDTEIDAAGEPLPGLVLNGGTLRYTGTGHSTNRHFAIGSGTSTIDASGGGALAFNNWWVVRHTGPTGDSRTLNLSGTSTANNMLGLILTDHDQGDPGGGPGGFGAASSLVKSGTGKWVIPATVAGQPGGQQFFNYYTGPTQVLGGTLEIQAAQIGGAGTLDPLVLSGGLRNGGSPSNIGQSSNAASNLIINGATFSYNWVSPANTLAAHDAGNIDRLITIGTAGATLDTSGNGGLNLFNANAMGFLGSGARTLTLTGSYFDVSENARHFSALNMMIGDGGGATTVTKNGIGEWVLTRQNTYTGPTNINAGTLLLAHGAVSQFANALENVLPVGTTVNLAAGAYLELYTGDGGTGYDGNPHSHEAYSQTVADLTGSGTLNLNSGTFIVNRTSGTGIFSGRITENADGGLTLNQIGGSFVKSGAGSFTLSNTGNNYTGATVLRGGFLNVPLLASAASPSSIGASTAGNPASNLIFDGGVLRYTGAAVTINRNYTLLGGGGGIDSSGGGAATFGGSMTVSGPGNRTFTLGGDNTGSNTLSSVISDTGVGSVTSLAKSGPGRWRLPAASTYTGTTNISGGTLELVGGNDRLPVSTALTISSGSLLMNNLNQTVASLSGTGGGIIIGTSTGSFTFGDATNTTYDGVISGIGGTVVKQGTGIATFTSAAHTYSGPTHINGGILSVLQIDDAGGSGIGSMSNGLFFNGGLLRFTGGSDGITARGYTLGVNGGGFDASSTGNGDNVTISGAMSVPTAGSRTLTLGGSNIGSNALTGNIVNGSGTVGLAKTGAGMWLISGAGNTYTGGTAVSGGTLQLAAGTNRLPTAGAVTITAGTLDLNDNATTIGSLAGTGGTVDLGTALLTVGDANNTSFAGVILGTGGVTKQGSGRLTLTGLNSYTGATTINAGAIEVSTLANGGANSGIGAAAVTNTLLVLNGGSLRYTGTGNSTNRQFTVGTSGAAFDGSGSGAASFTATAAIGLTGTGGRVMTFTGTSAADNTMAAQIVNQGVGSLTSVVKSGTGKWILSGNNTYTGTTTINGGFLAVNGTHNPSGAYTVNSGGTLGGTGSISSTITVNPGGNLAPGNSVGKLTILSDLTLTSGSTFAVEFAGTSDSVELRGSGTDFVIGGATLQIIALPGIVTAFAYPIVTSGTAGTNVNFSTFFAGLTNHVSHTDDIYTYTVDASSSGVTVTFSAVPEPASLGLMLLGGGLLMRRRRR